jgi:arginine decarboxylase
MFDLGLLDLRAKANIETVYWQIAANIVELFRDAEHIPEEVRVIEIAIGDQYLCNFSVFQSLLDHWALRPTFPVMPIHRLNERPTAMPRWWTSPATPTARSAKFIDLQDVKETLPLHRWNPGDPYYIGFFLAGGVSGHYR